ncbi:WhiB family transcriptional regulator [Actinomadura litoris]|uniref:WhiB family transcriptional regulator n=1 Tax=Actinomadura litoris TaxID=2678616 RepID=UPI0035563C7A
MIPALDRTHYRTARLQPRPGPDDPPTPCSLTPGIWAAQGRENEAMAGCRGCPILQRCHAWVLSLTEAQDVGGVVAAMTAKTRLAIRRSDRAATRRRLHAWGEGSR